MILKLKSLLFDWRFVLAEDLVVLTSSILIFIFCPEDYFFIIICLILLMIVQNLFLLVHIKKQRSSDTGASEIKSGRKRDSKNCDAAGKEEKPDLNCMLRDLQAQISPHFLCNTLECIRGQALLGGDKISAQMAEALSSYFRYSISSRGYVVSLKDEIENLKKYMKILEFRHGKRFKLLINYDMKADTKEIFIPKLLLQPIVENSIEHGLYTKAEGGTIKIYIMQNSNLISIDISDDGIGMANETIQGILAAESPRGIKDKQSHGIGIRNIIERIKLYYGEEYGLEIYSQIGLGTQVRIAIPFDKSSQMSTYSTSAI